VSLVWLVVGAFVVANVIEVLLVAVAQRRRAK
jgi:hypothetical protein